MAAFDLSIVPRRENFNELMLNTELIKGFLKERRSNCFGVVHSVCELGAVIRLDALDHIRELLHAMPDKLSGRIGSVFLERLKVAKPAVFVDERELVITAAVLCCVADRISDQARLWNEFLRRSAPVGRGIASSHRAWERISDSAA